MADNTTLSSGSGGDTIATDDIGGVKYQRVKISTGADGSATDVDVGGGVEAAALRVTVASDSTGVLSVDDNGSTLSVDDGGSSITVDNGGTFAVQADTELTTADLDTGAGTDTRAVVGLAGTASGGAQLIPGSSTDGLLVNLGANNDVTVTGTVTANAGSGPFPVSDNGGSLTVDNGGTFAVQAAQSGTWTVQPGNTANTTAWKVDASSVAVPITDNSGSLTVDNAGTFAVQDSQVVTDNAAFTDGTTKVQPVGYVFDEVAGTALTENDAAAARIDSKRAQIGVLEDATTRGQRAAVSAAGALKVDGSAVTQPVSDGGGALTVDNAGTFAVQAAQSGTWTVQPGNTANTTAWKVDGSAVTQPVSYATTGSGTATGALRVELPTNGTGVLATVGAVTAITNALPAGTNAIGKLAANSGVDIGDVDVTSIAAGTNTIGDVGVKPRTSGGLSIYRNIDLDEADVAVKASAGQLFGWYIFNAATSTRYVKFYDASTASTTVGTTTPVLTIPVPAGAAANVFSEIGIAFATAITAACVTGVADNNTGAPAANDVQVNFFYA